MSWSKRLGFQVFLALEKLGVHVTPRHFYSPVADRGWMADHSDLWQRPYSMGWSLDDQLAWLAVTCGPYLKEVEGFPFVDDGEAHGIAFRYGAIEGQVLHCAIRDLAPSKIVEVGGGASTFISSQAAARNLQEGRGATEILSIDPYPPPGLQALPKVTVQESPVQMVPLTVFTELKSGDVLFIDSSHALHAGSELPRLYLEIIPALAPGVIVQIHDIYLPWLYRPSIMRDFWDWQETTLLAALLTDSTRYSVLCCQSALHDARQKDMRKILPDYQPRQLDRGLDKSDSGHFPASIWLKVN